MTFQRRWKKRGAHLLDAPPSCRCPKIVPWYALVLDVDWFARAQGESGRTANRVANLFGCRVRPDGKLESAVHGHLLASGRQGAAAKVSPAAVNLVPGLETR